MKILSKYKDYYDYLAGSRFGIDNKVVLDRRKGFVHKKHDFHIFPCDARHPYRISTDNYIILKIAICGLLYEGLVGEKRQFFWGSKIKKVGEHRKKWGKGTSFSIPLNKRKYQTIDIESTKTDINEKENCPIVFVSGNTNQHRQKYPCLKELGIASIYPSEKIYMDIYNWLSKRNEHHYKDNRTDIQKLEAAGFNKKTSFRHR